VLAWLNQINVFVYVFVGMLCAQSIEQAPSDDASILNLFTLSHEWLPLLHYRRARPTCLSATGARRFVAGDGITIPRFHGSGEQCCPRVRTNKPRPAVGCFHWNCTWVRFDGTKV
jgi:hypothetical protein